MHSIFNLYAFKIQIVCIQIGDMLFRQYLPDFNYICIVWFRHKGFEDSRRR